MSSQQAVQPRGSGLCCLQGILRCHRGCCWSPAGSSSVMHRQGTGRAPTTTAHLAAAGEDGLGEKYRNAAACCLGLGNGCPGSGRTVQVLPPVNCRQGAG